MRQGEPEVVTTEEKEEKENKRSKHLETSDVERGEFDIFICLAYDYFAIQPLSLVG